MSTWRTHTASNHDSRFTVHESFGPPRPSLEDLTPLQLAVLKWTEPRQEGHSRPDLPGVSPFKVDEIVASLVEAGLLNAVAVPRRPTTNTVAHWEPTTLTVAGRKLLWEHRRRERLAHRPWWARLLSSMTAA